MTEAEWLACDSPEPMFGWLEGWASERKLILIACACCFQVLHLMKDERSRHALDVALRWAAGAATEVERDIASEAASDAWEAAPFQEAAWYAAEAAHHAISSCYRYDPKQWEHEYDSLSYFQPWAAAGDALNAGDSPETQVALLRDIVGNPFCHLCIDLLPRTPTVVSLAQAAYGERASLSGHLDNARLAVLSDAIEEAGCTDDNLLSHLRSTGVHVRGCWALDALLGKSQSC